MVQPHSWKVDNIALVGLFQMFSPVGKILKGKKTHVQWSSTECAPLASFLSPCVFSAESLSLQLARKEVFLRHWNHHHFRKTVWSNGLFYEFLVDFVLVSQEQELQVSSPAGTGVQQSIRHPSLPGQVWGTLKWTIHSDGPVTSSILSLCVLFWLGPFWDCIWVWPSSHLSPGHQGDAVRFSSCSSSKFQIENYEIEVR